MYIVINTISSMVRYVNLSREEMLKVIPESDEHMTHLYQPDYPETVEVGQKFLHSSNSFRYLSEKEVKEERNKLLVESDWRDLPSYPGTDQEAWRTYRQSLRDIPQDYTDVEDIVWPTKP